MTALKPCDYTGLRKILSTKELYDTHNCHVSSSVHEPLQVHTHTQKKCLDCFTCSLKAAPHRASLFSLRNGSCFHFSVTRDAQTWWFSNVRMNKDLMPPTNCYDLTTYGAPNIDSTYKYHLGPNLDSFDQTTCCCPLPSPIYSSGWSGMFLNIHICIDIKFLYVKSSDWSTGQSDKVLKIKNIVGGHSVW